jgi:hypothetical protein
MQIKKLVESKNVHLYQQAHAQDSYPRQTDNHLRGYQMTIESQAQSKRSNNLKLSARAAEFLLSRISGFYRVHRDNLQMLKTADALVKRGWMEKSETENKFFEFEYTLTDLGVEGYTALKNASEQAPVEPDAPADELPAKMPLAPLMDADTAPVMDVVTVTPAYAANDHVTFNYFRDPNYKDEVYQGRIMERAFDRLCGWMYRIDPAPCAFHLSPRWISERYVRTTLTGEMVATIVANDHVSALYDAMTMAEQVYMDYARLDTFDMPADHATFKRKVAAHITYLRAKQAYTGVRSDAMITYLYGAQNAPQTPHNGPSAVVDDVQAFSSNLDQRKPEIAAEPFAPVNATNDHPLALIQPGSEASKTDWDAQQAKRDAQHAEAKARVEALNGVYQAPVRKGIQMHSPEYLNQIFKQAHAK